MSANNRDGNSAPLPEWMKEWADTLPTYRPPDEQRAYEAGKAEGIRLGEQRATQKIVAWLRAPHGAKVSMTGIGSVYSIADQIERGDHLEQNHAGGRDAETDEAKP